VGFISNLVFYKIGRRRGRVQRGQVSTHDERDPECINYQSFCRNFGSCNGLECEYD